MGKTYISMASACTVCKQTSWTCNSCATIGNMLGKSYTSMSSAYTFCKLTTRTYHSCPITHHPAAVLLLLAVCLQSVPVLSETIENMLGKSYAPMSSAYTFVSLQRGHMTLAQSPIIPLVCYCSLLCAIESVPVLSQTIENIFGKIFISMPSAYT